MNIAIEDWKKELQGVQLQLDELAETQYALKHREQELGNKIWNAYRESFESKGMNWDAKLIPNDAFRAYCQKLADDGDPEMQMWIDGDLSRIKSFLYYRINIKTGMLQLMTYDISGIQFGAGFDIDFPIELCVSIQEES